MKCRKIILICFVWSILLSGCKERPVYVPKTVTAAEVSGTHARRTVERHYTDPKKVGQILNYLRALEFDGFTSLDPGMLPGDDFAITLGFADGSCKVYRVHGNRYLCDPKGNWEKVDPKQAEKLLTILFASRNDQ